MEVWPQAENLAKTIIAKFEAYNVDTIDSNRFEKSIPATLFTFFILSIACCNRF